MKLLLFPSVFFILSPVPPFLPLRKHRSVLSKLTARIQQGLKTFTVAPLHSRKQNHSIVGFDARTDGFDLRQMLLWLEPLHFFSVQNSAHTHTHLCTHTLSNSFLPFQTSCFFLGGKHVTYHKPIPEAALSGISLSSPASLTLLETV